MGVEEVNALILIVVIKRKVLTGIISRDVELDKPNYLLIL